MFNKYTYSKVKFTGKRSYSTYNRYSGNNNNNNKNKKHNSNIIFNIFFTISLIIITYIFYKFHIVNTLIPFLSFLASFLFISSLVLLYLYDFKLSLVNLFKYVQIFSFICIPLYVIYCIHNLPYTFLSGIILCAKDNNDIKLHGHVSLDKEAAKEVSKGLHTIGSVGLGATMAGVATAVGKCIAKSSLPPFQKAGVVLGASMIGGLFHSKITTVHRNKNLYDENIKDSTISSVKPSNINDSNISKLIEDNTLSSPLQDLLLNLEITAYVCITMLILLIIQILFKFYFKNSINLNLSSILGDTIEFYINKIIELNKKMSTIYMINYNNFNRRIIFLCICYP